MQAKNIKVHIKNKINDWANSIADNDEVKNAILKNVIVTGGAIVSLLQGDEPNDYDCYFKTDISCDDCICCINACGYINPLTGYKYSEGYVRAYCKAFYPNTYNKIYNTKSQIYADIK